MDKGLTVPKWALINRPKIPQMPQNLSAQIVCPFPKNWDFDEKRLYWASVVRDEPYETVVVCKVIRRAVRYLYFPREYTYPLILPECILVDFFWVYSRGQCLGEFSWKCFG
jgi:hypothetical protein